MKNILICFLLVAGLQQLSAQNTIVTVDARYRIDPKDSTIPRQKFFVARFALGFENADMESMLNLTATRILQKVNVGDSIEFFNPIFDLYPGFSLTTPINDCKNIPVTDFSQPAGQIGEQNWLVDPDRVYFKLKKKDKSAAAQNLIVWPDKKISYAADSLLTTDKKGNFIPLLRYRYLEPNETSVFFTEKWSFDVARGSMIKSVNYYGYYIKKYMLSGDFVGYTPVLCIKNPQPDAALAKAVLLKKNVICDVALSWPEQMLINDTNAQRYSGIDAYNYLTIPDGSISYGDRSKFLAAVFNFALTNPKNVSSTFTGSPDTLHPFTSSSQISDLFIKTETVYYSDPETNEIITKNYSATRTLGDVYAIRFYEDWYYDAKELTIKKVVRGIGLIMLNQTNMGMPVLQDAGIYIKMN
jgi:hypothetical protein